MSLTVPPPGFRSFFRNTSIPIPSAASASEGLNPLDADQASGCHYINWRKSATKCTISWS
jgi:CxxC motif-containing protein (DUF1111 family)